MIIILSKLKMNSSFLIKVKEQNSRDLSWFFAVRTLKRFVIDKNNRIIKDLSEIFKVNTKSLNTKISTEAADRVFIESMKTLRIFVTEISDSVKSLKKNKEKKTWTFS